MGRCRLILVYNNRPTRNQTQSSTDGLRGVISHTLAVCLILFQIALQPIKDLQHTCLYNHSSFRDFQGCNYQGALLLDHCLASASPGPIIVMAYVCTPYSYFFNFPLHSPIKHIHTAQHCVLEDYSLVQSCCAVLMSCQAYMSNHWTGSYRMALRPHLYRSSVGSIPDFHKRHMKYRFRKFMCDCSYCISGARAMAGI